MNNVLDVKMLRNDIEAETIKDYLKELLLTLWEKGEGFSGKRPFGNSGWEHELYAPLVAAGLVKGKLDEDGYIMSFDEKKANKLIFEAIESL